MSAQRIHVVHVISGLDQGGAEGMLVRLLGELDGNVFSHAVVSLTGRGIYGAQIEALGIKLYTLGMTGFAATPLSLFRLCGVIQQERPTIVQTWLYHADLLGLVAARMAGDAAVAWNVRCAGLGRGDVPMSTRWLTALLARLSTRPDAVLFNSMAGLQAHRAIGYKPKHSLVIPNGFDLNERRPDPIKRAEMRAEIGIEDGTFLVGMIARSHRMKAQSTFLAAAARLRDSGRRVRFMLVGLNESWTNKAMVADIDKYRLRDHITLLGLRQDIPRVMAGLDCLVSTSTSEGFPNVIGEAMASGVPCVATDAGDSRVIVGDTGKILPIGDVAGVVDAVLQLIDATPEERAERSALCRARITQHFPLSRIAQLYADFYHELDERRAPMRQRRAVAATAASEDRRLAVAGPRPIRIACLVSALNAGGAERVTVELASLFARQGHDVTLFVGWPSATEGPPRSRLDHRIRIEYILPVRKGTLNRYLGGVRWTWQNRRRLCTYDVVHCHLTYSAFVTSLLYAYRTVSRSGRPAIIETYHAVGMRIPPAMRWVHSRMAVHRDVLVLMAADPYWSRFTARHPRLNVRTVLNGTSTPDISEMNTDAKLAFRHQLGIPDDCQFVVGSVGFLRSDRQPEVFIPIISRLVGEFGSKVHWIFAGDGPEQGRLEMLVREVGIEQNVHFAGYIADVKYPLSIIDLYFTLSVGRVTGVAALEATLVGLPVIGFQLLEDYVPGADEWIWSSHDPAAVSARAISLLHDASQRKALGERQQEYARRHHSVDSMGESYQEIYKLVLPPAATHSEADRVIADSRSQ
jgi:glycosyltransferase involved in cell wall biosynthesis